MCNIIISVFHYFHPLQRNKELLDDMDTAGATSPGRGEEVAGKGCQGQQQGSKWKGKGHGRAQDKQQGRKSQNERQADKEETEGQVSSGSGEKQEKGRTQKSQKNWKCHS